MARLPGELEGQDHNPSRVLLRRQALSLLAGVTLKNHPVEHSSAPITSH